MSGLRNYWVYSAGLAVVWAVALALVFTVRGGAAGQAALLVFFGYALGWVSTTIARYVYPPPRRWGAGRR